MQERKGVRFGKWPFGRWIVCIGAVVGVAFVVGQLVLAGDQVFSAVWKGCVAALLVMALLGVGQRLWRGDKIKSADAGGVGVAFPSATSEAVEKVERAVSEINTRVNDQMTTINDRLYDLERAVFKEVDPDERDG